MGWNILSEAKLDPRVVRTRQLIKDALFVLASKKDFKDITIGEITEKAMVNRATFYAHFSDKYDLLEIAISDNFKETLKKKLVCRERFDRERLESLFLFMCEYHKDFSEMCSKSYQSLGSILQSKIIEELRDLIFYLLMLEAKVNPHLQEDPDHFKTVSTLLAWSLYGAAFSWNQEGRTIPAEELVRKSMPLFIHGLEPIFSEAAKEMQDQAAALF